MGVLDDAIRQHLELKRAHGADESELKRKEDEALGPVRREAEPAAEDGGDDAAAEEHPSAPEETEPATDAQEPAAEEPAAPAEEVVAEEPVAHAPPEEPVAFADDDPFADDEPFAEKTPAPPDDEPAPEPPAPSDTPTRGFDAVSEEELAEEEPPPAAPADDPPAGDAEDVLEETPEFLQETPEHDRLWFEQKPPRDFDFDDEEK